MKKVIDGKMYNTETAEFIGEYDNGLGGGDFNSLWEGLYVTKKGTYFIAGEGGAMTRYAKGNGDSMWGSEDIEVITKEGALAWCEENNLVETIEEHFADMIEEG